MNTEALVLLAIAVFMMGVLLADTIKTRRERDAAIKQAKRAADERAKADSEAIGRDHDESRARRGSDWFQRWLGR